MAGFVLMRAMNQEEILEIFKQAMTISNEHDFFFLLCTILPFPSSAYSYLFTIIGRARD
jgi:hypothetical protein